MMNDPLVHDVQEDRTILRHEIATRLTNVERRLMERFSGRQEVIVCVGNIGAGKSSLVKFLAFNTGMAFSQGAGLGPLIAVVATVVIVWLLVSLRTDASRMSMWGTGLLIGGAAGKLIDRLFRGDAWLRGGVVDFIDFQWFPIFNIADICINVGAGLLVLNSVLSSRRERRAAEQAEA